MTLSTRKMRVTKPRLRGRGKGRGKEVEVPAYEAMQEDGRLGSKILSLMMRGISTRNYEAILPDARESVGVSKSSVSRKFIEASEEECKKLLERRFDETDILVIYIDGMIFADHAVIGAVGVDRTGAKHVLGVVEGATENAVVVKALLESMVERGIAPGRKRLFVIDGAKALRSAIEAVYGPPQAGAEVQESQGTERDRLSSAGVGGVRNALHEGGVFPNTTIWTGMRQVTELAFAVRPTTIIPIPLSTTRLPGYQPL